MSLGLRSLGGGSIPEQSQTINGETILSMAALFAIGPFLCGGQAALLMTFFDRNIDRCV